MKRNAKRILTLLIAATALLAIPFTFVACNKNKSLLDPKKPTTLTMWHVYGEQSNSPMNDFVEKFNATVGKEKGIVIDVTLMSNASQIGKKLKDAQAGKAGSKDMPDLFFCHSGDAQSLGADNLLNWKDYFTPTELDAFVPDFLSDGMLGDRLSVFPVSKSTYMLFIAGGVFERFAAEKKFPCPTLKRGTASSPSPKNITSGRAENPSAPSIIL